MSAIVSVFGILVFDQCHKSLRVELISQNQLIKIHAQSKSSLFLKGDHGVENNHVTTLN